MFQIYKEIGDRVRLKLPAIKTIAPDTGQLANPEKAYPLNFPALLIDLDEADWEDLGKKAQKGKVRIGITVALLATKQGYQGSPNIDQYIQEMDIVNDVFGVLSGFLGLSRKKTTRQKRWDNVLAYTHLFYTNLTDRTAQKVYTNHPVPPEINEGLE